MAEIIQFIEILLKREDLTADQATQLLDSIFDGDVGEPQVAAFLTAMRIKGPTAAELAGLAKSLRTHAVHVKPNVDHLIDTCGTGGAKVKTFNISTAAAIVAAGAGAFVAKHGNRGITSSCGSADVLDELGVNINASADVIAQCIEQAHIGFMFAPMFHPAMKYVQPTRKALGFRTVFNILGPLANPANASAQVMGVADEKLMPLIAQTLGLLGVNHAMVVHSDGLDEISTLGITKVIELKNGNVTETQINPADFDIAPTTADQLTAPDAKTSAKIITDIISDDHTGPAKDIVLLNAAAAIIVADLAADFNQAVKLADQAIKNKNASSCLEKLIKISNS